MFGAFTAIESARQELFKSGFDPEGSIYLAGHSLGGVTVQDFVINYPNFAKGIILMGAAPLRKYSKRIQIPILSINGEMDGQVLTVFNYSLNQ